MTGSPVKVLGQIDVRVCLGLLEFIHQMLKADIVNEVIHGMDIMNAYRLFVDIREDVLRVDQEKIRFRMAKITGSANHLTKQVTLAEKKVNRCEQEEPLLLHAETEEELTEEVAICKMIKEMIGKPIIGC